MSKQLQRLVARQPNESPNELLLYCRDFVQLVGPISRLIRNVDETSCEPLTLHLAWPVSISVAGYVCRILHDGP
jgi:hypothetical protein